MVGCRWHRGGDHEWWNGESDMFKNMSSLSLSVYLPSKTESSKTLHFSYSQGTLNNSPQTGRNCLRSLFILTLGNLSTERNIYLGIKGSQLLISPIIVVPFLLPSLSSPLPLPSPQKNYHQQENVLRYPFLHPSLPHYADEASQLVEKMWGSHEGLWVNFHIICVTLLYDVNPMP